MIDPIRELTIVPSSPWRTSLAACPKENAPSDLVEASGATSGATGPYYVRGDEPETDEGSKQHEAVALGDAGSEGPSPLSGEEHVFSKQPEAATPDEMAKCDEGLSTPQGKKPPSADQTPEQHEAIVPRVAEGMGYEGLDTTRGEAPEEFGGMGFKVALPEAAMDMVVVSPELTLLLSK
ncbi:hypothetical protein AMTR_s00087p00133300 [Amborella trichopoda]|uniref:Uncharacterized protein n=1 Tax=Amborella trichopoda TaxID=13333 RepID=W1NY92_AMBTC|nr:hypothetical protein AMTR_s00087p00133300 [Amborella trichopoda]